MSCLPQTGGCERQRTDPFVTHLNTIESTSYEHEVCLDVVIRDSPQPEALYVDRSASRKLVIERKTLVWPPDYIKKHKDLHLLMESLASDLRELMVNEPYMIEFDPGVESLSGEVERMIEDISTEIKGRFAEIQGGSRVGSVASGLAWVCYKQQRGERAEGDPPLGVGMRWSRAPTLPPDQSPRLISEAERLLRSASKKFSSYLEDRRILVIEGQGQLEFVDEQWFEELIAKANPPSAVSEVWLSSFDWVTESERGWNFHRVFPVHTR